MKRLFLAGLGVLLLAAMPVFFLPWNRIISGFLSARYGVDVRIRSVSVAGWGKFAFRGLEVAAGPDSPSWAAAESGEFFWERFPFPPASARLDLHGLAAGGFFEKKAGPLWAWWKTQEIGSGSPQEIFRAENLSLRLHREGDFLTVRILRGGSEEFVLGGGARFESRRLVKMNAYWAVSRAVFSRWPQSVIQKMIGAAGDRRAAVLVFGGNTWTLRGARGPLLQFSGHWMPVGG